MDDGSTFMIVALIVLIGLSAFFSAAETAYNSLNEIRLKSKADDGDEKAAHTLALVERYDSLLSTILIGNNIVNIGASSLATVLFTRLVGGVYGPTVSTIVMTLLVLTFGEITPKSMAKEMPETMAMAFAPVLSALVTIFTPLNALFGAWKNFLAKRFDTGEKDTITEGELVTMVSEAEKDGELTNRESELIRSAIEFDDVEAQDVLTPRVDVVAVEDDTPMDEVIERFAESGYSRLPVYHDTIDNIIGVVHEKDCFAALQKHDKNVKLENLIGPTLYTTSVTQISALLRTLRESKHHMAVVVESTAARRASSRWRIFWRSWSARFGTNMTTWSRMSASSPTAAGLSPAAPVWTTPPRNWASKRMMISTLLPSAAWFRKSSAACLRWGTGSSGATSTAPSPAPPTAASRKSA